MDPVLDNVMKLKPSTYDYVNIDNPENRSWGFIAQEVEKIFPEIVLQSGEFKGLSYDNFAVIAIKAIQEQQKIIEQQQAMLDQQQAILQGQNESTLELTEQVAILSDEMDRLKSSNSYTKK